MQIQGEFGEAVLIMTKSRLWERHTWVLGSSFFFLNLCKPQFPSLESADNSRANLAGLLWGLKAGKYLRHLAQYLTWSQHSENGSLI